MSRQFELEEAKALLARSPQTLNALLGGLSDAWFRSVEGESTFSPFDVVGHLIDGEQTDWMARARMILARDSTSEFAPYDRYRHRGRNAEREMAELLEEFSGLRAENLRELSAWGLEAQQLAWKGTHPEFGLVSLAQLLSAWAVHDMGHVAQVARVLAKRYTDDVGPWRSYLPILDDRR